MRSGIIDSLSQQEAGRSPISFLAGHSFRRNVPQLDLTFSGCIDPERGTSRVSPDELATIGDQCFRVNDSASAVGKSPYRFVKESAMTLKFKLCVIATSFALLISSALDAAPKKKGGPKLVPFKGKFVGTALSETTEGVPDPVTGETADSVEVTIEGGGNGTHLGKYTLDATSTTTTTTDAGGVTTEETTSALVFVAANGDEVWATFSGESETGADGDVDSALTATITGGTGRFENSTGYFTLVMTTDPETGASTGTYNGKISGPGKGN